jgi:SnoaL-like domain
VDVVATHEFLIRTMRRDAVSHQESQADQRAGGLTREELIAVVERHCETELVADIDGVMATMTPEPAWTGYPDGDDLRGYEQVRARYARRLPPIVGIAEADIKRWWVDEDRQDLVVEIGARVKLPPDGEIVTSRILAMFEFEDGLIRHETSFGQQRDTNFMPTPD